MNARLAALALLSSLAGCYNYLPLTTADPQPGTRVSAQLSDSGTLALARYLGPDVAAVEGRLVAVTGQDIGISVVTVRNRSGVEHYWKGEVVMLPRGDVAAVRQRKLAAGRSAFLVLAGVGGSVALLEAFGVFGTGSGGFVTPPPTK
jgi:hypothetical protein